MKTWVGEGGEGGEVADWPLRALRFEEREGEEALDRNLKRGQQSSLFIGISLFHKELEAADASCIRGSRKVSGDRKRSRVRGMSSGVR